MTLVLHDYQHVAVDHLHRHPRAGLFLDMGLGKTAVALTALTLDHLPVLVTAPKRVAENVWESEAQLWRPDLRVAVAAGTPLQRESALLSGADIVVIGRDNLKWASELPRPQFNTFIVDEMSGFKARSSQRWKAARKIIARNGHPIPYVWGLTGTPSPNGLLDLWSQMYLLDEGARLGRTLTAYRGRYFYAGRQLPTGIVTEWILRPGADKNIHRLLEDICLSMETEGRIELPPVTYNHVLVPLPPAVRQVYKKMKDDLVADLSLIGGETHTAANAAVLSNRLSQISAGFLYSDDADIHPGVYDVLHREKVRAVQEIIEGTGSPVLVFYRYRAEKEMILEALAGTGVHTIDEPGTIAAWNRGEVPVLLAHPASAGHGLNLQHGGHTVVWASLPWSLEEWEQGNKRVARQGQRHPVVIHMLLSPKTVDGAIRERLIEKTSVQAALLRHLESPL